LLLECCSSLPFVTSWSRSASSAIAEDGPYLRRRA
jgi:hypothetical protein